MIGVRGKKGEENRINRGIGGGRRGEGDVEAGARKAEEDVGNNISSEIGENEKIEEGIRERREKRRSEKRKERVE